MVLHSRYFDAGEFVVEGHCAHDHHFATKDSQQIHYLVAESSHSENHDYWDGWISQKCLDCSLCDEGLDHD